MITSKECAELFDYAGVNTDDSKEIRIVGMACKYDTETKNIWYVNITYTTGSYFEKTNSDKYSREELSTHCFMYEECTVETIKNFIDFIIGGNIYGD